MDRICAWESCNKPAAGKGKYCRECGKVARAKWKEMISKKVDEKAEREAGFAESKLLPRSSQREPMTREFSLRYLNSEPRTKEYMLAYAKRNGIKVTHAEIPVLGGLESFVRFESKSRHQMLVFGTKVCQRFLYFEFW